MAEHEIELLAGERPRGARVEAESTASRPARPSAAPARVWRKPRRRPWWRRRAGRGRAHNARSRRQARRRSWPAANALRGGQGRPSRSDRSSDERSNRRRDRTRDRPSPGAGRNPHGLARVSAPSPDRAWHRSTNRPDRRGAGRERCLVRPAPRSDTASETSASRPVLRYGIPSITGHRRPSLSRKRSCVSRRRTARVVGERSESLKAGRPVSARRPERPSRARRGRVPFHLAPSPASAMQLACTG